MKGLKSRVTSSNRSFTGKPTMNKKLGLLMQKRTPKTMPMPGKKKMGFTNMARSK